MEQSNKKCDMLEECGFFLNYSNNTDVVKQGWIRLYCENRNNKAASCARKKQLQETGEKPPDNLAPNGLMLPG